MVSYSELNSVGNKILESTKIRQYFKDEVRNIISAPSKVVKHNSLKYLKDGLKTYSKTMAIVDTMLIEEFIHLVSNI